MGGKIHGADMVAIIMAEGGIEKKLTDIVGFGRWTQYISDTYGKFQTTTEKINTLKNYGINT